MLNDFNNIENDAFIRIADDIHAKSNLVAARDLIGTNAVRRRKHPIRRDQCAAAHMLHLEKLSADPISFVESFARSINEYLRQKWDVAGKPSIRRLDANHRSYWLSPRIKTVIPFACIYSATRPIFRFLRRSKTRAQKNCRNNDSSQDAHRDRTQDR